VKKKGQVGKHTDEIKNRIKGALCHEARTRHQPALVLAPLVKNWGILLGEDA